MVKDSREKWDISSDRTGALTREMHTIKKNHMKILKMKNEMP